jgi:hypothetical protein
MALLTMGQVNDRAAALLDDPAHRRFSANYLRQHIDQQNEQMLVKLSSLGLQQQEQTAIFNLGVQISDLTPFFQVGQPLQYLLRPMSIDWKVQGQPDTSYQPSFPVQELADVDPSNLGCDQYRWAGGTLQVTPSGVAVTLRVHYLALNVSVVDPNQQIVLGIGFLLALMTARFVAAMNNGMGTLIKQLDTDIKSSRRDVKTLFTQQMQQQNIVPRGIRMTTSPVITAGGSSYS